MAERALKVYWAGDLFDAKDLGGNLLLAQAVEAVSGGRYQVCLPQQAEGAGAASQQDLLAVRVVLTCTFFSDENNLPRHRGLREKPPLSSV